MIKLFNNLATGFELNALDGVFLAFGCLNIIDVLVEVFTEKHLLKKNKKTIPIKKILRKKKLSLFK